MHIERIRNHGSKCLSHKNRYITCLYMPLAPNCNKKATKLAGRPGAIATRRSNSHKCQNTAPIIDIHRRGGTLRLANAWRLEVLPWLCCVWVYHFGGVLHKNKQITKLLLFPHSAFLVAVPCCAMNKELPEEMLHLYRPLDSNG